MASFVTNRGKYLYHQWIYNAVAFPANLFAALATDAVVPTVDTNTWGELTEIAVGNGYSAGGISLSRNVTDFPAVNEDDLNDLADIGIRTLSWTESGGGIPASGSGASWCVLMDDNGTPANRQVIVCFDLVFPRTSSGGSLDVPGMVIRNKEP